MADDKATHISTAPSTAYGAAFALTELIIKNNLPLGESNGEKQYVRTAKDVLSLYISAWNAAYNRKLDDPGAR